MTVSWKALSPTVPHNLRRRAEKYQKFTLRGVQNLDTAIQRLSNSLIKNNTSMNGNPVQYANQNTITQEITATYEKKSIF
jgi:hypothetical protein